MKILITGGAGFIGSALIWELNSQGFEDIIIVDHISTSEKWKNLRNLRFKDYFEKEKFLSDLKNNKFDSLRFDFIFHLGACSSTTEANGSYLIENNFEYSKEIAKFAHKTDARLIYASSAATYGNGELGFNDREENFEKLQPLNMYGYSKHLFDIWMKKNGLLEKAVGMKYFNVFGPNEYHKQDMRSFVLKAYEQIITNKKVNLFRSYNSTYKDGEHLRDFIYVKDAVRMTAFFMHSKASGIFNIATGQARTWNDLVKAVFKALNQVEKIEYISMPENIKKQYQYFTEGNISKIRDAGYKDNFYSLEDAISDYITNYLAVKKYL